MKDEKRAERWEKKKWFRENKSSLRNRVKK